MEWKTLVRSATSTKVELEAAIVAEECYHQKLKDRLLERFTADEQHEIWVHKRLYWLAQSME